MKEEDFPAWAREIIPELIQRHVNSGPEVDECDEDSDFAYRYNGLWEYPLRDAAFVNFAKHRTGLEEEWGSICIRLLTDDRSKHIWNCVKKAGIRPQEYEVLVWVSFHDYPRDKTALMTQAERKAYLEETRDMATALAARLSGTRYEDQTSKVLMGKVFAAFRGALRRLGANRETVRSEIEWVDEYIKPIPFDLAEIAKSINEDIQSGAYKESAPSTIFIGDTEYRIAKPTVDRKHITREGQRAHFYKGLASRLNTETGSPRPTLVALTTSLIFSDLNALEPNYVSKNWNK